MKNFEQKACYNCGSLDKKLIHKGVRDNENIDVYECQNCGLVFLSSDAHINDVFYQNGQMVKNIDLKKWIESTKEDDNRRFITHKNHLKDKIVCDFGCGNGGFLMLAKRTTLQTYGIELQRDFYSYFKENNLNVFSSVEMMPEKVDIITMFHVLEHLKNPVKELNHLSNYLAENGKIIIEVPSANDALLKLYHSKCFADFTYWSCHLFLFNKKNLIDIVERAGFKVQRVRNVQRYGLINHLYWLIKNKPAGHKKWRNFDFKIINIVYGWLLGLFSLNDTIEIIAIKNKDA